MTAALTRVEIIDSIYKEVGLSKKESGEILQLIFDEITGALVEGQDVKISSFGRFSVRNKKERLGRNPRTGIEASISKRTVASFKASQLLKKRVNK